VIAVNARRPPSGRLRSAAALVAWMAILTAVGVVLVRVGRGPLAAPPLASGLPPLRQWAARRDAPTIVMAALRAVALALDGYVLATAVLGLTVRLIRSVAGVRLLDRVTPPSVRRLLGATVGGVMLSAPMLVPLPRPAAVAAPAVSALPVMRPLLPARPGFRPSAAGAAPPTSHAHASLPKPVVVAAPARPPDLTPRQPPSVWVVRPGDNFWEVARRVLDQQDGRPATAATIVPFWRVLIDDNLDRAPDPNLIRPGQLLRVPPPP
jgi:hypothetical protein